MSVGDLFAILCDLVIAVLFLLFCNRIELWIILGLLTVAFIAAKIYFSIKNTPPYDVTVYNDPNQYGDDCSFTARLAGVTKTTQDGLPIQELLPTIRRGSQLKYKREHNNPYDSNAIAVYSGKHRIGYIKAELAKKLAPRIDSGARIKMVLDHLVGGGNVSYGCVVRIVFLDGRVPSDMRE